MNRKRVRIPSVGTWGRCATFVWPVTLAFLLIASYVVISVPNAKAETQVIGRITEDTTWTSEGSPYLVIGDVTVDANVTLTIENLVDVLFDGYYSLTVKGFLYADGYCPGTILKGIVFTSNKASPQPGDWKGIFVETPGSVILKHVAVKYGEGVFLHNSGSNIIEDSVFSLNDVGVAVSSSSFNTLERNTFQHNNLGISMEGEVMDNVVLNSTIQYNSLGMSIETGLGFGNLVQGNTIGNNSNYGIQIDESPGGFEIRCNMISANLVGGISVNNSIMLVHHNDFYYNGWNAWEDMPLSIWNDPGAPEGNYWDDYTGNDTDKDGIGDTPYHIEVNSSDFYPLMEPVNYCQAGEENLPPVAMIEPPFQEVEAGEVAWFTGNMSYDLDGYIVSYYWEFGDGAVGDGVTVTHAYSSPGDYIVTLTVTDNDNATGLDVALVLVGDGGNMTLPDLTLSSSDISFSNDRPEDGEIVTINATIHNIGSEDASNVTIEFWDNADCIIPVMVYIGNDTIPNIPSGGSGTASTDWDTTGQGGDYNIIWVFADPDNEIEEQNENNNAAARAIYVNGSCGGNASNPIIFFTMPVDGEVGVKLNEDIFVAFSESMNTSSLEWTIMPDPGCWNESWSIDDSMLMLSHCNLFEENTTYIVEIIYAESKMGYPLVPGPMPNPWYFSTIGENMPIPPVADAEPDFQIVGVEELAWFDGSLSYDPDGVIVNYTWYFGDGLTDYGVHVEHTYHIPGMYGVTLWVYDDDGLSDSDIVTVLVMANQTDPIILWTDPADKDTDVPLSYPIHVTFSWEMDPSTLNWTISPDPGGWTVSWSLRNTVLKLTHSNPFEPLTTYEVEIIEVKDACGNPLVPGPVPNPWQFTTSIGNLPPVAIAVPKTQTVHVGEEAWFDGSPSYDPDGFIVDYHWDFGDGSTGYGPLEFHAYDNAGAYNVTLRVTDNDGLEDSDLVMVEVIPGGEPPQPILVLSAGLLNIGTFPENTTRTVPVEVAAFYATITNVHIEIVDAAGLEIGVQPPNQDVPAGRSLKFYLEIKVPELEEGKKVEGRTIQIQAIGDQATSNVEYIDLMIREEEANIWWTPETAVGVGAGIVSTAALASYLIKRRL